MTERARPGFTRMFREYLMTRTDCPPDFHTHAALTTLAAALGNRVWTHGRARPVYPNVWSVVIARSGSGKSVPLDMSVTLLRRAGLGDVLMPATFSQEGLTEAVLAQPVGLFVLQEFARFMQVLGKDYNSDSMQALTEWFDVPDEDIRVLRGQRKTITKPTISILGASSPQWFEDTYKASMLRGGFLARFLFAPSEERGKPVDDPGAPDTGIETVMADHLRDVAAMAGEMDFSGVRDPLVVWVREQRAALDRVPVDFHGMRARAELMVKKVAMLFHAGSDPRTLRITERDLRNAIRFVERGYDLAERYITEHIATDRDEQDRILVRDLLYRAGGSLGHSETLRASKMSAERLDRAVRTLSESGLVDVRHVRGKGRTGAVYALPMPAAIASNGQQQGPIPAEAIVP